MYVGKIPQNVFLSRPNLKVFFSHNNSVSSYSSFIMIRNFSLLETRSNLKQLKDRIESLIKTAKLCRTLHSSLHAIPRNLRDQSSNMIRVWAHQCECVFAQRLRRGQQMFCLYTRLWEDKALIDFLNRLRYQITKRSKEFILSSVGVAAYNWEANRIPDSIIDEHRGALEYVYLLKEKTICDGCTKKKTKKQTAICECEEQRQMTDYKSYDDWVPFIEENDLTVWRRLHASGQYEYKVYGSYGDVCAEDFLNVQIDTDYRKKWDTTAVVLEVVEKDPKEGSNSDVIYWEMLWPRIFANRDYVFNRKYIIDSKNKLLFIASKTTEHPVHPKQANKHRVQDYWSYMVIKPYTDIEKPGIEFVLTYFDNPGVNIPGSVTTWVAYRAMPDFLQRLREAAKKYKLYCKQQGTAGYCNFVNTPKKADGESQTDLPYCDEDMITDNTISEAQHSIKSPDDKEPKPKQCRTRGQTPEKDNDITAREILTSPTAIVQADNSSLGYWKYLKPTYYFS